MNALRESFYYSILWNITKCCVLLAIALRLVVADGIYCLLSPCLYMFLVLFLRSSMVSPIWSLRAKWTVLLSVPVEALLYGGGLRSHFVALLSLLRFFMNYGFVLNWNPVLKTNREGLANRVVEILVSAFIFAILSPWFVQTFIVQVVLYMHGYWLSTCTVEEVCGSGVIRDSELRKALVDSVHFDSKTKRIPIEVWLLAYDCATSLDNSATIFPSLWVEPLLSVSTTPWELRRLVVKAIGRDPTRAELKCLLGVASAPAIVSTSVDPGVVSKSTAAAAAGRIPPTVGWLGLLKKGPCALISEEANEKTVINEAILCLMNLFSKLGERKFTVAFDKASDSKLAMELIKKGFK